MRLNRVLGLLRQLAPEHLAEPWDKVGLHAGDPAQQVRKAMLCIDLTGPVLEEAIKVKAELVVAYHPPIFQPLAAVTNDDAKGGIVYRAVRQGIALYSPHTALDAAEGGVNDWLAAGLGEGQIRPIRGTAAQGTYKLVVFVPEDHADKVRRALATAGAGRIGNYTACSFSVAGEGTFRGRAGSNPTIGKPGRFERVRELRMEMVCPATKLAEAVAALQSVHPYYEEPAFDLHRLEAVPGEVRSGQGRVVELVKAVAWEELVRRVKRRLKVKKVEIAKPQAAGGRVRRIGLCVGSGGSLLAEAGLIDAFVTGEMRHHDVLNAVGRSIGVILAGHTQTERPYLPEYRRRIVAAGGQDIEWLISRRDRPPSTTV